jgi:hypothetical protein
MLPGRLLLLATGPFPGPVGQRLLEADVRWGGRYISAAGWVFKGVHVRSHRPQAVTVADVCRQFIQLCPYLEYRTRLLENKGPKKEAGDRWPSPRWRPS